MRSSADLELQSLEQVLQVYLQLLTALVMALTSPYLKLETKNAWVEFGALVPRTKPIGAPLTSLAASQQYLGPPDS